MANPPYIAPDDPHLPALDRGGEPMSALVSADDGYGDLQLLIDQARRALRPGGWLLLEHGWTQAPAVRARLAVAGYQQIGSSTDLGGHERVSFGCVAAS
jgi:release factor glutamine methyltransferase